MYLTWSACRRMHVCWVHRATRPRWQWRDSCSRSFHSQRQRSQLPEENITHHRIRARNTRVTTLLSEPIRHIISDDRQGNTLTWTIRRWKNASSFSDATYSSDMFQSCIKHTHAYIIVHVMSGIDSRNKLRQRPILYKTIKEQSLR